MIMDLPDTPVFFFLRRHYPDQVKGYRSFASLRLSREHPAPLYSFFERIIIPSPRFVNL
jgi:hypothetical protein